MPIEDLVEDGEATKLNKNMNVWNPSHQDDEELDDDRPAIRGTINRRFETQYGETAVELTDIEAQELDDDSHVSDADDPEAAQFDPDADVAHIVSGIAVDQLDALDEGAEVVLEFTGWKESEETGRDYRTFEAAIING